MQETTIGFIGGGNMARSLIGGLLGDNCEASRICFSEPDAANRQRVLDLFHIRAHDHNSDLVADCGVVVLAVKPQVMYPVCQEIAQSVQAHKPLVVSVAAGVRLDDLQRWLGGDVALIRTMPNTPALVRSGATALFANKQVSAAQRELGEALMRAVGLTLWLENEGQMDAVTALSGSGPAYFFLVMEALEQAGIKLGLPAKTARLLALQTAFGAAKMALESSQDAATLRANVTSPGGTTERAIGVLQGGELEALFDRALQAAHGRSEELAAILGKQDQ